MIKHIRLYDGLTLNEILALIPEPNRSSAEVEITLGTGYYAQDIYEITWRSDDKSK